MSCFFFIIFDWKSFFSQQLSVLNHNIQLCWLDTSLSSFLDKFGGGCLYSCIVSPPSKAPSQCGCVCECLYDLISSFALYHITHYPNVDIWHINGNGCYPLWYDQVAHKQYPSIDFFLYKKKHIAMVCICAQTMTTKQGVFRHQSRAP